MKIKERKKEDGENQDGDFRAQHFVCRVEKNSSFSLFVPKGGLFRPQKKNEYLDKEKSVLLYKGMKSGKKTNKQTKKESFNLKTVGTIVQFTNDECDLKEDKQTGKEKKERKKERF